MEYAKAKKIANFVDRWSTPYNMTMLALAMVLDRGTIWHDLYMLMLLAGLGFISATWLPVYRALKKGPPKEQA